MLPPRTGLCCRAGFRLQSNRRNRPTGAGSKATLRELCVILDGSHRKWGIATLALLLLATAGYAVYVMRSPGGPRGGSLVGLLFGIAGSALMIFAGLISLRKKVPTWPIGSAQAWLRGHIWLGLLSVPLILFHAGFRWGGPLEQVLLIVTAAVIISGLIDLGVQQFFPRQMTARVPLETFYAQIPFECRLLQLEGDVAVATACGPLPVPADESVATSSRLKLLGVSGRQPLPLVYRMPDSQNGQSAAAKPPAKKPAAKTDAPAASAEPAAGESKPLSPAEKIAAMRAAKAAGATATVEKPSAGASSPSEAAEKPAPAKMSAAEKIAAMRAAKKPAAEAEKPAASEAAPADVAAKPAAAKLSAAEKIAMMRAAKKPADAAADASVNAVDHSPPPTSATQAPEIPSPAATSPEQPAGAKSPMSAAEKIALMRSLKHTSQPAVSETPTKPASEPAASAAPAVSTEVAEKKPLSAAEKIALMRAGKKPAADQPAPAEAVPPAAATPATATPSAEAKKALTAADKIAMMRAKGKPAAAASEEPIAAAAPQKPAAAIEKKPAAKKPAEKVAAEAPIDPAEKKRAADGLEKFYLESVRPFLAHESRARGALASEVIAGGVFAVVGSGLTEELRPVLQRLLDLCEKRRQLSVQERIHWALHFWLFIHVPLSLALLGLGVAHAIMSVYY